MKRLTVFFACFVFVSLVFSQQLPIMLEDIWQKPTFFQRSVPGFNFQQDGIHYTRLEGGKIQQYELLSGNLRATLFDAGNFRDHESFSGQVSGYTFSADESKILIESETEKIYRHSTRANYYVFDRKVNTLTTLYPQGKQRYASFNKQANKVAFVSENNLFFKDLKSDKVTQVTTDGETNKIINGATDWVYEEEFGFDQAYQWSPDGQRIAFYRFDETAVPEFTMTNYHNGLYPEYVTFKYPKVGEVNSDVTIHIYDTRKGSTIGTATSLEEDYYIPRIKWTADPEQLCVYRMNRHQNKLELLLVNAVNGKATTLLEEKNKHYISEFVLDNLIFLEDGKRFVFTSEKDGWHHIYLHDMKGKEIRQITSGQWEVSELYGVDEKNGLVFYQAAEKTPMERQVYSVSLNGKRKQKLANKSGWNAAQFSPTFDHYVVTYSTINSPPTYAVHKDGKEIRMIEDNAALRKQQSNYATNPVEFFQFETEEGTELNGWMVKPIGFKERQRYPVLMYVYGGPGSQTVKDQWGSYNYWWFQHLAQLGFVVVSVDNRGTGGRGEEFKKMTYLDLGKYETEDQIEAAKYLGTLSFVDKRRIGIFGWSYGGYMSSLCKFKGGRTFRGAIAIAPVTNWKWYDTIYTERYMRTEKENREGYEENSPVNFADKLKGAYLLVHGMGDDNVHFQHSVEMANALISANKQFDTYFYPNRNHGIYGDNARLHLYTKMTNFLVEKVQTLPKPTQARGPLRVAPSTKMLKE